MRTLLALVLAVLAAASAQAHERSRSNSVWTETETGLSGRFYLEARQATLLLALDSGGISLENAYRERLIDGLQLRRGEQACALDAPPLIQLRPDGRLEARSHWTCTAGGTLAIDVRVFSPLSANHVHFIRLESTEGISEQVLSRGRTTAEFEPGSETSQANWSRFLSLGFTHIIGGPDHVAFVLGLMLLVSGWRRIAIVTLGFTLGHSVTLALAVTGWVSPPGAAVESLIGFSILFIAAEAALTRQEGLHVAGWGGGAALLSLAALAALTGSALAWPIWLGLILLTVTYFHWLAAGGRIDTAAPALSAGFGLVHGVGFAGILLEIDLSGEALIASLIAFNLGVEIGQIAIVVIALAVISFLRRIAPDQVLTTGRTAMIAGLAGLGSYWFLGRAFL
ncbi:HupE/UreJ family protein [Hyphobacterium sp.]|uniref:HupE/UreJ family protein n=1 Tax=Hyphobacterium sp. TaxID=2004662 RepID=UPI003B517137